MARKQSSAVLISGSFLHCQEELNQRFKTDDLVELKAKGSYIEMAIMLAEHCIQKGWAQYDRFLSGLASEEGKDVPEVSIKLRYVPSPQPHSDKESQPPKRKEYRQRENEPTDKPKDRKRGEERKGSGEGKGYY